MLSNHMKKVIEHLHKRVTTLEGIVYTLVNKVKELEDESKLNKSTKISESSKI